MIRTRQEIQEIVNDIYNRENILRFIFSHFSGKSYQLQIEENAESIWITDIDNKVYFITIEECRDLVNNK